MSTFPKKYDHRDVEKKWRLYWDKEGIYRWVPDKNRAAIFSIDTPPPTVSGSLHIGHVFSYTQTDLIARYQRMSGKSVFYPMGWDDNGLPTERRVQNIHNIACNPTLKLGEQSETSPTKGVRDVSRDTFIKTCSLQTKEDERAFESLWRTLGLSVDWNLSYATIDENARYLSQYSFLDLSKKGLIYKERSPSMWDTQYKTAVSQAEVEDRMKSSEYHYIRFSLGDGDAVGVIATTRPELLAACIALVAHPSDERYQSYFGTHARVPLFEYKVPFLASDHAIPEKGTGLLMVCTFGDIHDVEWWRQSSLPMKPILGPDGCLLPIDFSQEPFLSRNPEKASSHYTDLLAKPLRKVRQLMVEKLRPYLDREAESVEHAVKFYEKGDTPIEFLPTYQWFVKILSMKSLLLSQGEQIDWKPSFMKSRYDNWVLGLNQDWCISRQRFFGVPFPVWYPLDQEGTVLFDSPIFASEDQLPVDPYLEIPLGYVEDQRNKAGGFIADSDVMDTWATSALTPQIAGKWQLNDTQFNQVFPFDLRPQSHEIIRTWAFYTIVKAFVHHDAIPWSIIAISGWILDPDRKKMSKSKGNVVTPEHLLDTYSSDAVRYWAAKARLGVDTAFDEKMFVVGKKLVTKLFNASKFVLSQLSNCFESLSFSDISEPLDDAFMDHLKQVVLRSTNYMETMDYTSALEVTETSFWRYCDHYIELVKKRSYSDIKDLSAISALATLKVSLKTYLKLFAPYLPYVTEEIWSWSYSKLETVQSIHRSSWPKWEANDKESRSILYDRCIDVITEIRAAKTRAGKGMKHGVFRIILRASSQDISLLKQAEKDLKGSGSVEQFVYETYQGDQSSRPLSLEICLA